MNTKLGCSMRIKCIQSFVIMVCLRSHSWLLRYFASFDVSSRTQRATLLHHVTSVSRQSFRIPWPISTLITWSLSWPWTLSPSWFGGPSYPIALSGASIWISPVSAEIQHLLQAGSHTQQCNKRGRSVSGQLHAVVQLILHFQLNFQVNFEICVRQKILRMEPLIRPR